MRIVQIVPEVRTGSGVEAVAHHLEREWRAAGIATERFTLADAAGGWLPGPGPGVRGKLALVGRVVWFSTVGTLLARRRWGHPDADTVVICHNDALAGDIYVNHGIVAVAMRARGQALVRMVRNPLHLFTWVRDAVRFAGRTHRWVVNLTTREDADLRRTYPAMRPRTVVIGNGVDTDRYAPPTAAARAAARDALGLRPDDTAALFVGHEYGRKGLDAAVAALVRLPASVRLVVVGGTPDMIARARADVAARGLHGRVRFAGAHADPRPWFHAADLLVFPSRYESYGLVVTEALACGLPVVATPTGCVPDAVVEGGNGFVTTGEPDDIARAVGAFLAADRDALRTAARASAEQHAWPAVAARYVRLGEQVLRERQEAP